MSIAKATGQFTGREFHGPAAIPIATAAISLFTGIEGAEGQAKAAKASEAYQGQELATLGQEQQLAGQIANAPIDLSGITRAGESGIETLKSNGGQGTPNSGALIKQLLGGNLLQSQTAAIGQKQANQNTAAGILGGTTGSLNQLATQAGGAASAGGNPWSAAAGAALNAFPKKGGSPVVTGPGGQTGGDLTIPSTVNTPGPSGGAGWGYSPGGQFLPDFTPGG